VRTLVVTAVAAASLAAGLACGSSGPPAGCTQLAAWWHSTGHAEAVTLNADMLAAATAPDDAAAWTQLNNDASSVTGYGGKAPKGSPAAVFSQAWTAALLGSQLAVLTTSPQTLNQANADLSGALSQLSACGVKP
jgi:hypothetical protein